MSVNSSSLAGLSLLPLHLSSNFSLDSVYKCFNFRMSIFILSFSTTYILLLPLLFLVLYLGYQQWKKQHSSSSYCESITYHSIAMQLNEVLGIILFICGHYNKLAEMMPAGLCVWSLTSLGQALFQLLTCVIRYLAVVHPITYMGLRRNISIGCVWVLSIVWMAYNYLSKYVLQFILYTSLMVLSLIVVCFCSISVLYALKQPGPGEVGGTRKCVDQSKQSAFHSIVAIMGVQLFSFGAYLTVNVMYSYAAFVDLCTVLLFMMWFSLPSRLVLPLLFLQWAGKLQSNKHTGYGWDFYYTSEHCTINSQINAEFK